MADPSEKNFLSMLFDVVRLAVWSAGGDGDGRIVSKRFRELAEALDPAMARLGAAPMGYPPQKTENAYTNPGTTGEWKGVPQ